jgi:hypothetical protein
MTFLFLVSLYHLFAISLPVFSALTLLVRSFSSVVYLEGPSLGLSSLEILLIKVFSTRSSDPFVLPLMSPDSQVRITMAPVSSSHVLLCSLNCGCVVKKN